MDTDFVGIRYDITGEAVEYLWGNNLTEVLAKVHLNALAYPNRTFSIFAKDKGQFIKKGTVDGTDGVVLITNNANRYPVNPDGTLTVEWRATQNL